MNRFKVILEGTSASALWRTLMLGMHRSQGEKTVWGIKEEKGNKGQGSLLFGDGELVDEVGLGNYSLML